NASHPFGGTSASLVPNATADRFSNFINFEAPKDADADGVSHGVALLHAYNAKLDFVAARPVGSTVTDPTTNEAIIPTPTKGKGSGANSETPGPLFPVAPGSTMVRYFIGLQNPEKHYYNPHENLNLELVDADGVTRTVQATNTYILYRAQFTPLSTNG